jgi:hypothetical protein
MFAIYQQAIIDAQFEELKKRIEADHWAGIVVEREETLIYVCYRIETPVTQDYLVRIDMSHYPVDPYWIGFINPGLPRDRWNTASDSDPRFWPWSPMPGLHGSFNLSFQGPFRTFWCRPCTMPFFHYHGDQQWKPGAWDLSRVVAHLRDAIDKAVPPNQWRPLQQQALFALAARAGINLPTDAGLGAK